MYWTISFNLLWYSFPAADTSYQHRNERYGHSQCHSPQLPRFFIDLHPGSLSSIKHVLVLAVFMICFASSMCYVAVRPCVDGAVTSWPTWPTNPSIRTDYYDILNTVYRGSSRHITDLHMLSYYIYYITSIIWSNRQKRLQETVPHTPTSITTHNLPFLSGRRSCHLLHYQGQNVGM